jgi:hypothetical protein
MPIATTGVIRRMNRPIPDFKAKSTADQRRIGRAGAYRLLDAGRKWDLAPVGQAGGAVIFPHATIDVCGHQIAAAVHACLDSGARRVVVLGVLHARTPELELARARVAAGGDCTSEPSWGLQGPGLSGREDWRDEFSVSHFQFLWEAEVQRRGVPAPELIVRYPFLAGGRPEMLHGADALREAARDAVVVATMDAFHHGIGYGDSPEAAMFPEAGGLEYAREKILDGLNLLKDGDYLAFQNHCVRSKSDGRDVGQLLRWLLGPLEAEILDLIADDMAPVYGQPTPTWVAGALIAMHREVDS